MEQFEKRLNQPPDPRADILAMESFLFVSQNLEAFDTNKLTGSLS